ncbi:MAG: recombinase family protein [Phycisphaerales bacterium]|nr:MAG: recombinase family protein [Phycisphaerales bacterium]
MSRTRTQAKSIPRASLTRCAVYTRKSSDEGLHQEFNSLDAQREAAEAYIASQKNEGWIILPDHYDDGGYTGGNMERPALQRLLADIEAGRIDCVVVYKVDRLSRSLMDFAKILETFERHKVSFVSVTQHFNTTHSMGRLTLNILLSFAQFEREIIGERIRDKIAASRQKGKWTGGTPILGYDVDRSNGSPKLVVNPAEASRVRQIFEMYLEHGTLLSVVAELNRQDWRSKVWTTRSGEHRGGLPIDKCRLHALLTNVLYVGKVRHKKEVYAGEHKAIVPADLFHQVQTRLQQNRNASNVELRNRYGALLRRLLYCKACGRVMAHTFTSRGHKRYRYYTCTNAIKNGRRKCPTASLPAGEIEKAVVDQIRCIGQDPDLLGETLRQARSQAEEAIERLTGERRILKRGLARCHAEIRRTATSEPATSAATARIADLTHQVGQSERRLAEVEGQVVDLRRDLVTEADVAAAFADFDNLWIALTPREQVRLVNLLVHRVEFDASDSSMEISFYPLGIKTLAAETGSPAAQASAVEDAA